MISDSTRPGSVGEPGIHESGFAFRRIDARAVDAGLSIRFRAVIGASGLPHAEIADPNGSNDAPSLFALRALREFSAATGMPATTRVIVPGTEVAASLIDAARSARLDTRRVIVDLTADRSRTEHLLCARAFSMAGFLVATRIIPATLDVDFLSLLAADYLHITAPPPDFAEAADLREVLSRVIVPVRWTTS